MFRSGSVQRILREKLRHQVSHLFVIQVGERKVGISILSENVPGNGDGGYRVVSLPADRLRIGEAFVGTRPLNLYNRGNHAKDVISILLNFCLILSIAKIFLFFKGVMKVSYENYDEPQNRSLAATRTGT